MESIMASYGDAASTRASRVDHKAPGQDALLLFARLAIAAIFVQSGYGKLVDLGGFTAGLASQGVPLPGLLGPSGAAIEFLGGLALALGAWTRMAALLVAAFTVVATLIAHRFWDAPAEEQILQAAMFMKNLAITGGLLALVAAGGGRFGLDGWRRGATR
jgi:putative oxidoreductase